MTNMKVSEPEFDDLLKEQIQLPSRPPKFFDICGLTFKEYVFNNLYAYYLNPIANHGLRDIFLNAICELIREKTGVRPLIPFFRCFGEKIAAIGGTVLVKAASYAKINLK